MPLSETIICGLPRASMNAVSSRATRLPDGNGGEALARDVIHNVKDAKSAPQGELIVDEVERPARVALGLHQDRRSGSNRSAPCLAFADCQPFLAVEALDAIDT